MPRTPDPRLLAIRIFASSGARLARTGAQLGGETGAALVHALRDMVIDTTVDPAHWPLAETLEMLQRHDARPDAQVDRLITSLAHLRDRIAAGST